MWYYFLNLFFKIRLYSYLCEKEIRMNQINIIPKIIHDKFAARIIMDDYDIEKPIVITVVARRNDGEYNTQILTYPTSGVDYEGNVRIVFLMSLGLMFAR